MAEPRTNNPEVAGSTPAPSTSPWSPDWSCAVVAPEHIRCAIDRALVCEWACCPDGCEADKNREHFRPFKKDQQLLPNNVTGKPQGGHYDQISSGT